jgi:lysophospholipase L1-like esterase
MPAAGGDDNVVVAPAAATIPTPTPGRTSAPNRMVIIGDSISAGTGAAGNIFNAGQEQKENSWATGTANNLNSMFQRLLPFNSSATADNRSANGKNMSDADDQANAMSSSSDYVVIQMGGNDLCRPSEGQMTSTSTFRNQFVAFLDATRAKNPNALIYVTSIPDIYNLWYLRGAPNPPNPVTSGNAGIARTFWDNGLIDIIPCKSLLENPTSYPGSNEDRRLRVRQRNIDFNAILDAECAKVLRCRFDNYAMFRFSSNRVLPATGQPANSAPLVPRNQFVFVDGDISTIDHFHPSFAGHVKLAEQGHLASYDWSDDTVPQVSSTIDRTRETQGTIRVNVSASDAAGVRGMEYRVHLPGASPTAWTTLLASTTSVDVPAYADQLAHVEVRALDRNGNMSAGTIHTVHPLPAVVRSASMFQQRTDQGGGNFLDSVRVYWNPPGDETREAVSPVLGYEAVAAPGGQRCTYDIPETGPISLGCAMVGLEPGIAHTFTVRARTAGGWGPWRTATRPNTVIDNLVFKGKPGLVESITSEPNLNGTVRVSWASPTNTGGAPIINYDVVAVPTASGEVKRCLRVATATCEFSGLVRGAPYDLTIVARNRDPDTNLEYVSDPVAGTMRIPFDPTVPTPLQASPTADGLTVTWNPIPASQQGLFTEVTIWAEEVGANTDLVECSVPATLSSCTFTGLTPLRQYNMTWQLNNGIGMAYATLVGRPKASWSSVPAFSDVPNSGDAVEATRWLRANNVTRGVGAPEDNKFGPSSPVTRDQMASFLHKLVGLPAVAPCTFRDQAAIQSWARPGACWLKEQAVTVANPYNPAGSVTRGQMAGFLWRLAGKPSTGTSCTFRDQAVMNNQPEDFRKGACWLKSQRITEADPYNPAGVVTRQQMAQFLYRFASSQL